MKKILLFGAGKSATCLISYLVKETAIHGWELQVADSNLSLAQSKIGSAPQAKAVAIQVENDRQRDHLVKEADIVISLLPPTLHFLVARSCIQWGKNLLTASYLDENIKSLESSIKAKGLFFLCEMGLDPGIDHMSAMQLIHRIKKQGGIIQSFRSHTGGLVSPLSDNNPWRYKISWNPRNVVMAGAAGAKYKEDDLLITKTYEELFSDCREVTLNGLGKLAWYPNRDSLSYIPVYGLEEIHTFIRTTLRFPAFIKAWSSIIKAGLTNDQAPIPPGLTFSAWASSIAPYIDMENREQLDYLGLFEEGLIPELAMTSADVLQILLETKLVMKPDDKDMIVMLHEIDYILEKSGTTEKHALKSSLIVHGADNLQTAMAKTVGLPLGIAAKLILEEKIGLTGLHIPILPAIYEPVLKELSDEGVKFEETDLIIP
ncbi:saccharopine dehydrogenase C-terminal domain-containing protein [Flavitalea flava]